MRASKTFSPDSRLACRSGRAVPAAWLALALAGMAAPFSASAGDLAGALIGGAIGSRIGQGHGQIAATAAGAYLGSKAGEHLSDPGAPGINAGNMSGAILGGAIGSQFGEGNGRLAATAAGALIGSNVADRMEENSRRRNPRPQRGRQAYGYDESPAFHAPQQRHYRPSPHYLSSEPGGPVIIYGGY